MHPWFSVWPQLYRKKKEASPCSSSKSLLQVLPSSPQSSRVMGCLLPVAPICQAFFLFFFFSHIQMALFKELVPSCHTSKKNQEKKVFPSRCTCTLLFYRRIHQFFSSERIFCRGTMSHEASISFPFVFQGNTCPSSLQSRVDPCTGSTC